MSSIFTKIYQGEMPGFVVAENEVAFALLNRFPARPGHLLVIPKQEVGYLFDVPVDEYQAIMEFTHQVAQALKKTTKAEKIGVVVEGFGVRDHAHIHLLPLNGPGELAIEAMPEASDDELAAFANKFKPYWPL